MSEPSRYEPSAAARPDGVGSEAELDSAHDTLARVLDSRTVASTLCRREGERIRCLACAHRCLIGEGRRGICRVRFVKAGELRVPFGYVAGGLASDPVEKKPFFHVYPGSDALTFGMLGCNFHCPFCQNWVTSQALRESISGSPIIDLTPEQVVNAARRSGARLVVSSYNEPLISIEWAVAIFQKAKLQGLVCALVSNGYATPEVIEFIKPWVAAYKIDLKGFDDRHYRMLGGTLEGVKTGIRLAHENGLWVEIVTLIVPGFNDSETELRAIAKFIASVSPDIPWHVTAFHPDYKMTEPAPTSARQLIRAAEIGAEEGLRFVYAGNLPGRVGTWENTHCPKCREKLIDRYGFLVREYKITPHGTCPSCGTTIPGIWPEGGSDEVNPAGTGSGYFRRAPRKVEPI
ncbi:MAG: AmmeMemoRadiSam system radical SAM enzyme [Verrucomicrobiae bacterium]|nr:AmmeMemoRadiSam system radical SAM enzyme [Verrucomicrobiae bacterium]